MKNKKFTTLQTILGIGLALLLLPILIIIELATGKER